MQAIILAAGQGTRMRGIGASKPMISVEGTALLERVVRNAITGGVSEFVIVTGYNADALQDFVKHLASQISVSIRCVENAHWHLGNGRSVLAAKEFAQDAFHLLMADHLVDPEILKRVRYDPLPPHGARLGVDFRLNNPHVDIEDVTKVLCNESGVVAIGKTLTAFNGFDTGVFWASRGLFNAIEWSIGAHSDDSLSGGIRVLAESGLMSFTDIGSNTWIDVDTPALLELAQQAVCQSSELVV